VGGFDIYERKFPKHISDLGLEVDGKFTMLTELVPSDPKQLRLVEKALWADGRKELDFQWSEFKRVLDSEKWDDSDEKGHLLSLAREHAAKVKGVYEGLANQILTGGKGAVNNLAETFMPENWTPVPVSLCGEFSSTRFVPPAEWFPAQVRQVSPLELLNLLPEAEAKTVLLTLGRACVGANGEKLGETLEEVKHTFRTFPFVISDPGMGKSTLFGNYILGAMKQLGFSVSSLPPEWVSLRQWVLSTATSLLLRT